MSHNTGLADGLHRYLRISYGEMDDNNAATYMKQGSNYNDTKDSEIFISVFYPNWLIIRKFIKICIKTK